MVQPWLCLCYILVIFFALKISYITINIEIDIAWNIYYLEIFDLIPQCSKNEKNLKKKNKKHLNVVSLAGQW